MNKIFHFLKTKTMKKKLLFCIILVSSLNSQIFAQCQASFTWLQSANNIISFTNTSTGTSPTTNYFWNFGDQGYSVAQNPVHTYNVPGIYSACLTITDSIGNCSSSFCDSFMVTGVLICNMTVSATATPAGCGTCTDGTASAIASSGTPPYNYLWQTVPPQATPTATGLLPGTYTCCVTDVNGCTACNTATIGISTCQANFTWSQTANNTITFTNASTGTSIYTNYHWTFGDASQSGLQNPSRQYSIPGTYTVCLNIQDSTSTCYSTFCDTITVTGMNCNNIALSVVSADASCPSCTDGLATANPSGGNPPFTYLWNTSATTQTITNLPPGMYNCCITDALGCTACASAFVDSMGGCSSFFILNYVSPQTYNAVNLATGAPPLSYLWSWGDNTTSNTAYPTHTYASPGFYFICLTISDPLGCSATYCDSFNLVRMSTTFSVITVTVVPPGPSGINDAAPENYFSVFPNPAADYLFIDYSLAASANTDIILYDMLGNKLQSFNNDMAAGKHGMVFDISPLKQGIYLLSLRSNYYSVTKTISIIK